MLLSYSLISISYRSFIILKYFCVFVMMCNHIITHAFWPRVLGLWPARWGDSLSRPVRRCAGVFAGRVLSCLCRLSWLEVGQWRPRDKFGRRPTWSKFLVWFSTFSRMLLFCVFYLFYELNCTYMYKDVWTVDYGRKKFSLRSIVSVHCNFQ